MNRLLDFVGRFHGRFVHGRREHAIARHLAALVPPRVAVLDIGCGDGFIDRLITESRPDISISGIDILIRQKTHNPVQQYDGLSLPYADRSFDVVMLVDVLHHHDDPLGLLRAARRVARRSIIVKDVRLHGLGAGLTLRFMDWVGNAPYGVPLPYSFWTAQRWQLAFAELELKVGEWREHLGLYTTPFNWAFERQFHFVARLDLSEQPARDRPEV